MKVVQFFKEIGSDLLSLDKRPKGDYQKGNLIQSIFFRVAGVTLALAAVHAFCSRAFVAKKTIGAVAEMVLAVASLPFIHDFIRFGINIRNADLSPIENQAAYDQWWKSHREKFTDGTFLLKPLSKLLPYREL